MGRGQAELEVAAPVAGPVPELVAARAVAAEVRLDRLHHRRRQLQHVVDRPADGRAERQAGDRLRRAVEGEDALAGIGGRQAARQAVDDVLVERLQVGDLARGLLEPRAGRPQRCRRAIR